MRVMLEPILGVLGMADVRFRIPVFQRVYSWTQRQCAQLFDDILKLQDGCGTATDGIPSHFLGTLIYLPESDDGEGGVRFASLIDGQQRMTTLTLLLTALRNRAQEHGGVQGQALAETIDADYLFVEGQPKLVLSDSDAETLATLVRGGEFAEDEEPSRFLVDNLAYFAERLSKETVDAERLMAALDGLQVVAVQLETADAAQQVFESLNAKGKPLSTTDLLRNTLLLKYGLEKQERLFTTYWAPIDEAFAAFAPEDDIYLDAALHAWLTEAAPEVAIGKRSDLYQAYKAYLAADEDSLEDILRSISEGCLAFAADAKSQEAREHINWVIDKPKGLISERKVFGD